MTTLFVLAACAGPTENLKGQRNTDAGPADEASIYVSVSESIRRFYESRTSTQEQRPQVLADSLAESLLWNGSIVRWNGPIRVYSPKLPVQYGDTADEPEILAQRAMQLTNHQIMSVEREAAANLTIDFVFYLSVGRQNRPEPVPPLDTQWTERRLFLGMTERPGKSLWVFRDCRGQMGLDENFSIVSVAIRVRQRELPNSAEANEQALDCLRSLFTEALGVPPSAIAPTNGLSHSLRILALYQARTRAGMNRIETRHEIERVLSNRIE